MRKVIKHNYKFIIGVIVGLVISVTTTYAIDAYIESNKVAYTNHNKTNVEEAIDELYEKIGMHNEKWYDPTLKSSGNYPILNDPLIPVEIKSNGDVYYANENNEWYNYSEKRWANAVILVDNPSNTNYQVGDHIIEDDIESYFVWIPRYSYKIWDLGQYTTASYTQNVLTNSSYATSPSHLFGNNRIIDIKFVDIDTKETGNTVGTYLTHPAFTLGGKNLNGIWVGKFETGYKGAADTLSAQIDQEEKDSVIIKPDVYAWRSISTKNAFMTSYNYERELDSHMMKNTEWGVVAYLSHSQYGIGGEVNINNNSQNKTGYSAAPGTDQSTYQGISGTDISVTQPWNSPTGYLASTTGNITGIYDLAGGSYEMVSAYRTTSLGSSGFTSEADLKTNYNDYFDVYGANPGTTIASFNYRILGDATGEIGPFYAYKESYRGIDYIHGGWYGDYASWMYSEYPWFIRGGLYLDGIFAGVFSFNVANGKGYDTTSFRIVLAPTN